MNFLPAIVFLTTSLLLISTSSFGADNVTPLQELPSDLGNNQDIPLDTSIPSNNLIDKAEYWAHFTDELGSIALPKYDFIKDGLLQIEYTLAKKEGENWPWLTLEATLPYTLKGTTSIDIEYKSTHPITISLPQTDFINDNSYANYQYNLTATDELTTESILLSEFQAPDWAPEESKLTPLKPEEITKIIFTPAIGISGGNGVLQIKNMVIHGMGMTDDESLEFDASQLEQTQIVRFQFMSTAVDSEYSQLFDAIIDALNADNRTEIEITGYTSTIGSPVNSELLALRSVRAVAQYFLDRGIPNRRIIQIDKGIEENSSINSTEALLTQSSQERRVELRIIRTEEQINNPSQPDLNGNPTVPTNL